MFIAMTSVFVHDVDAAFRFYTEVLGFVEQLRIPEAGLAVVVSPDQPSGSALLLEPNGNPVARTYQEALYRAGLPPIVFGVTDIHQEYERLTARGVVFRQTPTTTDAGTQAVFDDTCGNYIQLHQAGRAVSDRPGR